MTSEEEKMRLVEQRFLKCYENIRKSFPPSIGSDLAIMLDGDEELDEILSELGMDYGDVIHKWFEENSFDNPMSPTKANLVAGYMISIPLSFAGGYDKYAQESFTVNGQEYGILAFVEPDSAGESKRDALHILFTKEEEQ
jgi:hypothetical protein